MVSESAKRRVTPAGPLDPEFGYRIYPAGTLQGIKTQAIPVVESADPVNESAIFRSVFSPETLVDGFNDKIQSVHDLFEHGVAKNPNAPALGTRPAQVTPSGQVSWGNYKWMSYGEVAKSRQEFGCGLQYLYKNIVKGSPEDKWRLGIFSINRAEWVIADLGAQAFGLPVVALYDTLGPDTSEFILNHSEIPILVVATERVPMVLKFADKCPKLKVIIAIDPVPAPSKNQTLEVASVLKSWAADKGISFYSFSEVTALGKNSIIPFRPPSSDDVFCVCYTSGTTGNPKGALLTNRNMVATIRMSTSQMPITSADVHISYLPLAHIYERVSLLLMLFSGASAGFYRGDVALLVEDIGTLRPTIFISVPRLLNRIYDRITNQALHSGSALKATLFSNAISSKISYMKSHGTLHHSLWDPLVFNKAKAVLGGRVRVIVSASAPISGDVMEFLRVVFGCEVVEAYGQTECTGGLTVSWPNDYTKSHVGPVSMHCEMKLVSVPEMSYFAKDLKGEIWVRGHNVFKGYLKDEAKTKETVTEDGWLKTGDIGSLDKYGKLSIIDRKKNIFKLAQGEYVAPEKLENSFVKSSFVAQIYVHGDSLQSELVAVVVPDAEYSVDWAVNKGILPPNTPKPTNPQPGQPTPPIMIELCKKDVFKAAILQDLTAVAKADKLRGFEFVKAVYLEPSLMSVDSGLLTPTFKMKRHDVAKHYRPQIDALYKEITQPKAKL